jgi:alpha-tubulin suppressor-like RCC1 family protein
VSISNLETLGYRFKGLYSPSVAYVKNDIVKKDGELQIFDGSSFSTYLRNQQIATEAGALLAKGVSQVGSVGQQLYVEADGVARFSFGDERSGTTVLSLPETWRADCSSRATQKVFSAVMADGTIRAWGYDQEGQTGIGVDRDTHRTLPVPVGFPPDAPAMVRQVNLQHSSFAIDVEGGLWSWGHNGNGELGRGHTSTGYNGENEQYNTTMPWRINHMGSIGGKKVIDIATGDGVYGYRNVMVMTEDRLVHFFGSCRHYAAGTGRDGDHSTPTLVQRSKLLQDEGKYVTKMFSFGHAYMGTFLLDNEGCLWGAGEHNTIGNLQHLANPNVYHAKFAQFEGKRIKEIVGAESDHHGISGNQYYRRYGIVFEDGDIAIWGHAGYSLEAHSNHISEWTPAIDPRISNVKELRVSSGGYNQMTAVKYDGTVWAIGYDGFGISGGGGDTGASWKNLATTNSRFALADKLIYGGSHYHKAAAVLRTDGKVLCWGKNSNGIAGDGIADQHAPNRIDYVKVPNRIVDIAFGGTWGHNWHDGALFMLDEFGSLWVTGSNSRSLGGFDDDAEPTSVATRVLL